MLQNEISAVNINQSKSISYESVKFDSSQSNNPVFKIAPLDNFQSFSENKYSHIFSSIIQSPRLEEQQNLNQQGFQQISKKRAFSLTEVETTNKDPRQNTSGEIRVKKKFTFITTRELECIRKKEENQLNAETPKLGTKELDELLLTENQKEDQQIYNSPKHIDDKLNDNYNFDAKQTQTTNWGTVTSQSELDQILKECLLNFEKNKAQRTEKYVACIIF